MFDVLIRNCALPDGRKNIDIAVADGRIAAIAPALPGEAHEIVDAERLQGLGQIDIQRIQIIAAAR